MADEIHWPGASGQKYHYWVYTIGTPLDNVPGNYIFAKETEAGRFRPIYIGQTSDLSERFDDHHKMPCIKRNGATHIHAHKSSANEDVRIAEEQDLIERWNPPCNG